MIGISVPAFFDEFEKIARARRITEGFLRAVEASKGALGKKAVPKSKPMTITFRDGKMIKRPIGSPPPLPQH
jgi:hypothetical protein